MGQMNLQHSPLILTTTLFVISVECVLGGHANQSSHQGPAVGSEGAGTSGDPDGTTDDGQENDTPV